MRSRVTALGALGVFSVALLYSRLYFADTSRLYVHTSIPVYRWQAAAFLKGQTSLPLDFSCAGDEMILYKGRLYYYFLPLPSFLHAGYLFLSGKILGRPHYLPDSPLVFLFVVGLAAVIFAAYAGKMRAMGYGPTLTGAVAWAAALAVCGFSFFFSIARYRLLVFEQAALFSAVLASAAVLSAYLYLLRWRRNQQRSGSAAAVTSLACAGAMLCRLNYATFPLLLLPVLMVPHLKATSRLCRWLGGTSEKPAPGWGDGKALIRGLLFLAAPAAALGFLLIHNRIRFDDPFQFGARYVLMARARDMRNVNFGSEVRRAPFTARLIDSIQGYLAGYDNPLFFPGRGPVAGREIEKAWDMTPPFTLHRVNWILFPLAGALAWHFFRLAWRKPAYEALDRVDLVFLVAGGLMIGQHLCLSTYFPDIVYRYSLDMLPGFLALALSGLGFRGSYLPVTAMLAVAFVYDAPYYIRVWLDQPAHYLRFDAGVSDPPQGRCDGAPIPTTLSCGSEAERVHPRARVGWEAAGSCEVTDSAFLVFSTAYPAAQDRWRLQMITDEKAVRTAADPMISIQGNFFPLRPRQDGTPGFIADFTMPIDALTAKAFPVAIRLGSVHHRGAVIGKVYSVRLGPAPQV